MLTRSWTAFAALVVLAASAAPPVGANGTDTEIVLSVSEACPGDRERCFAPEEGDLADLEHGHGVRLVLENTGDEPHSVHVATLADADPDRADTPPNASFASTDTVPPGGEGVLAFAPPGHADGVYFWDPTEDHEQRGLWLAVPYGEEPEGLAEPQEVPLAAAAVPAALVLASLAARRGARNP